MRLAILGAGAWGSALAVAAASWHEVSLWARDPAQAAAMQTARENARYLPGVPLPARVRVTADLSQALAAGPDLCVLATPMAALRGMLGSLQGPTPVLWLCKGFEAGSGLLGHEIAAACAPGLACGILSGPSFAQEVAAGLPAALVVASPEARVRERAVEAFHRGALRIYSSTDPIGVEVGGAVKNVLAIATGVCDGLQLGLNARAALITRGLAEMTRLGVALGARTDTFAGLAGLGDLVLTATGDLSRNRRVGLLLAEGLDLSGILQRLGHVAEGVYSAATVVQRAAALGVDMPIAQGVHALLQGQVDARQLVELLMRREARAE
ncbi:NAD(P)H-dependent glycerol-3-phosphate dehydrogenase [Ideonella alba]|uniref:Glycerol-3-phosphate dehydrogenase [NAD(P)+] n=1 Tax=Ideonella alba TaxID=2824118 RepID=A0A940YDL0_9BURK|nr:NAD(P)H-dependent glycerol-3-phosphate dehydrogenase [Ideonella alba]MBQ0930455.1 NAD(P)-dependent glycerol-3-phosphate dehydrogenase [Ideonella alba]